MLVKEARYKKQEARVNVKILFFFLFSFFYSLAATAQCAMCRASLESEGNKTKVEAVNDGIVFLMAIPYLLAIIIGYVVYKMYFKKNSKEENSKT